MQKLGVYTGTGATFKFGKVHVVDLTLINAESWSQEQVLAAFSGILDGTKSIPLPARMRSVGKNLTDIRSNTALKATSGVSLVTDEGRTCWKVNNVTIDNVIIGIFKPNTRYTLSMHGKQTAGNGRFEFFYTDGTSSYSQNFNTSFGLVVQVSTAGKTVQSIRCGWANPGTWWVDVDTFMLHEGAVALPYEPYTDSTLYIADNEELRSVPAISDKIFVENGVFKKVGNVGVGALSEENNQWNFYY